MAFHFNWSPLIADTDRVRHMLTSSLNRSPRPPIIVDDIIVNELNLGQTPPSLEILEIGDLAEDRFRGIFKVKYEGDAYLQLRTKVQANPLNTFLSSKHGFASPDPLAAGSGLTIPLQITLSDIRLSGFVILVFNKQKGITIVFRNDPIESLKVSSTFDSIPFVRNYLQKTIEEQLRVLFVEDLPAIIHRLSLRVFDAERANAEGAAAQEGGEGLSDSIDDLSAQQDPAGEEITFMSFSQFEGGSDSYPSFSQSNILRLAALNESQRTLSLFTPSIRDTVVRAWTRTNERGEYRHGGADTPSHKPTSLSRIQSQLSMSHGGWSSNASQASDVASQTTRPSISNHTSVSTTYSLASGRSRGHGARKKKHRVVNLRKTRDGFEGASDTVSVSSDYTDSASRSGSVSASGSTDPTSPMATSSRLSSNLARSDRAAEKEGEVTTPYTSPKKRVGFHPGDEGEDSAGQLSMEFSNSSHATIRPKLSTPRHPRPDFGVEDNDPTPRASMYLPPRETRGSQTSSEKRPERAALPRMRTLPTATPHDQRRGTLSRTTSDLSISDLAPAFNLQSGSSGGILEQAWMTKMATEIAKRVAEEKEKQSHMHASRTWNDDGSILETEAPPPAYSS